MRARLVVTRGQDRGREYELRRAATEVGRGRANDIVLTDPGVSRHHLSVFVDGGGVRVRDHGSGNGTHLNGARLVGETRLADGDELELGDTALKLVAGAAAEPVRVPEVRGRTPRRDVRPVLLVGAGIIAASGVAIVVVALMSPAPAPLPAPPSPTVAPPPVVITALPETSPTPPITTTPADPVAPRRRKPAPATATSAPRPSSALREAAARYAAKDFAEAVRLLRDAGDEDASEIAKDYALVGAGLARGDANAEPAPQLALGAYQDALAADARSGEGAHASLLRAKIARVAPAAARAYLDAGRLEQARAACDLAVNYGNGGDARVAETRSRLDEEAGKLFARAQAMSDAEEAKLLYRRIVRIVPAESGWSKKALEASR